MKSDTIPSKWIIAPLLITGSAGTIYGMIRADHTIFLAGIALLLAGYGFLRKELKRAASRDSEE